MFFINRLLKNKLAPEILKDITEISITTGYTISNLAVLFTFPGPLAGIEPKEVRIASEVSSIPIKVLIDIISIKYMRSIAVSAPGNITLQDNTEHLERIQEVQSLLRNHLDRLTTEPNCSTALEKLAKIFKNDTEIYTLIYKYWRQANSVNEG